MLHYRPQIAATTFLMLLAGTVHALDAGLPFFRPDMDASVTVDVYSEAMDRDIEQEFAFTEGTFKATQEENRAIARITGYPSDRLSLHASIGITDAEESESVAPLVGGGVNFCITQPNTLRLDVFIAGYYVDEIDYERSGALTQTAEIAGALRSESYYEIGGGLRLSAPMKLKTNNRLVPYAGVTLSTMQADGEERIRFVSSGLGERDDSVDFEDDSPVSVFAGLALLVRNNFGARLEGRFIDQTTIAAGIFFSF